MIEVTNITGHPAFFEALGKNKEELQKLSIDEIMDIINDSSLNMYPISLDFPDSKETDINGFFYCRI